MNSDYKLLHSSPRGRKYKENIFQTKSEPKNNQKAKEQAEQ